MVKNLNTEYMQKQFLKLIWLKNNLGELVKIENEEKNMASKKITKNELYANVTIVGRIASVELRTIHKNGYEFEELKILIKWSRSSLFVFERELNVIKKMQTLKVDDVISITGVFEHAWFPGAKSVLPTIAKVLEFKKLGGITNE